MKFYTYYIYEFKKHKIKDNIQFVVWERYKESPEIDEKHWAHGHLVWFEPNLKTSEELKNILLKIKKFYEKDKKGYNKLYNPIYPPEIIDSNYESSYLCLSDDYQWFINNKAFEKYIPIAKKYLKFEIDYIKNFKKEYDISFSKEAYQKFLRKSNINKNELEDYATDIILQNSKTGEENFVIGISGGKDSTIVFKLLEKVIGRDRIYPVFMPFYHNDGRYEYIEKFEFNSSDKNKVKDTIKWLKKFNHTLIYDKFSDKWVVINSVNDHKTIIPNQCILYFSVYSEEISFIYNKYEKYLLQQAFIDPIQYNKNNLFYTDFIGPVNTLRIPISSDIKDILLYHKNLYYDNKFFREDILFGENFEYRNQILQNTKNIFDKFENEKSHANSFFDLENSSDRNFVARMRMNILYYVAANIPHGRVVNTSNFSEKLLGWTTKWGDNVGDIFPISNFTCNEVLALGEILKVPEDYLFVKPSDGMVGKTDEEALGVNYYPFDLEVINVLKNMNFLNYERRNKLSVDDIKNIQFKVLTKFGLSDRIKLVNHKIY